MNSMDLEEVITVAKFNIDKQTYYLMIGWQTNSFEMHLFSEGQLWKGRFSRNRLAGFSRNLQMAEDDYFNTVKKCLSHQRDDYIYELKSGFFYWKRMLKESILIEGFMPMEVDTESTDSLPDLVEVVITVNKHLKKKIQRLKENFETVKTDYQKCLSDTDEFLNLKIEMEKALSDKFLSLLNVRKTKLNTLQLPKIFKPIEDGQ